MNQTKLTWQVGFTNTADVQPQEWYEAKVPGSVQQDYARAKNWPPFYEGVNFKEYGWMEDVYWLYKAPLTFDCKPSERAVLVFRGIDYAYEIRANGEMLAAGEGMFSTVRVDVTRFAGKNATLEVLIFPAPKFIRSGNRNEANHSCKACACYGWDWHPRLISAGLWDEVYVEIEDARAVETLEASYVMAEDLTSVTVTASVTGGTGKFRAQLLDGEKVVCTHDAEGTCTEFVFENPKLWNPVGYGEQNFYTLRVSALEGDACIGSISRRIGFRRVKLVMGEGTWAVAYFPKSRAAAPATIEINGRRIFAKGSNWVNAQVFGGDMCREHYRSLLEKVRDCNMNILRVWGGGFINKESFFDLCDELGIMIWQEFPLACNEYPDDDKYLSVLKSEATAIVRRLRTHPCMALWCGGNELFNSWSGMTEQHHALRLLDSVCYLEDRFTPFNMTSPLNGMAHGNYFNYDEGEKREFITAVCDSHNTAYTEFGAPGLMDVEYLRTFMSEEDLNDMNADNEVWVGHHGFKAWRAESWVRTPEAEYYFGGWKDLDDLCKKTSYIQAMGYRSLFEEMRKQWPFCSMALNWCLNEPWPTVGHNNLIAWPDIARPSYYAVQQALRAQMASLRTRRNLWWDGETFTTEVWMLNDAITALPAGNMTVFYQLDGSDVEWGTLRFAELAPQTNKLCGSVMFPIPTGYAGKIKVRLEVENHPEMSSAYEYLCRSKRVVNTAGMLNV
ncbi:MAG: hypothetical protein IIY04_03190 [Oscillospiraceae bacterium]|nr:hypothetical protein [Oscillospiraceae bacterium]